MVLLLSAFAEFVAGVPALLRGSDLCTNVLCVWACVSVFACMHAYVRACVCTRCGMCVYKCACVHVCVCV